MHINFHTALPPTPTPLKSHGGRNGLESVYEGRHTKPTQTEIIGSICLPRRPSFWERIDCFLDIVLFLQGVKNENMPECDAWNLLTDCRDNMCMSLSILGASPAYFYLYTLSYKSLKTSFFLKNRRTYRLVG